MAHVVVFLDRCIEKMTIHAYPEFASGRLTIALSGSPPPQGAAAAIERIEHSMRHKAAHGMSELDSSSVGHIHALASEPDPGNARARHAEWCSRWSLSYLSSSSARPPSVWASMPSCLRRCAGPPRTPLRAQVWMRPSSAYSRKRNPDSPSTYS